MSLLVNVIKEISRLGMDTTYITHGAYGDSTSKVSALVPSSLHPAKHI